MNDCPRFHGHDSWPRAYACDSYLRIESSINRIVDADRWPTSNLLDQDLAAVGMNDLKKVEAAITRQKHICCVDALGPLIKPRLFGYQYGQTTFLAVSYRRNRINAQCILLITVGVRRGPSPYSRLVLPEPAFFAPVL